MEFNNYYPAQAGHPPPNMSNQQHSQIQHPPQQPPQAGQMIHSPMPQQTIRQTMPPGSHQQQIQQMQAQQQQQNMGHQQQQIPSQQQHQPQHQQHQNYHQIQSNQHGPPVSHSSSPHAHPNQHHNHQSAMPGPLPQQTAVPNQHVHPQSPHHHGGPTIHIQQQSLNQMVRPSMGTTVMNHPQAGMQQPIHHHHQQNFFSGGPIPQSNLHHYPQQNQHHQHHHHHHPRHQSPMIHQGPHLTTHHPHIHQGIGRNSPYYPNILQTEFRIIELNKRLQCRPIARHPINPLPSKPDESLWWDRFVSEFFEDDATLTLRTHEDKPVEYTIGRTLIPRFFKTYFDGGVTDLSFHLRNSKEACMHPQMITLDCDQAFIITNNIFKHPAIAPNQGVVVHTEGHLILDFVSNNFDTLSIKSWRFYTKGSREYIDRSILATMGMPNAYLAEPVTRNGLTKSTISYLKMCMIMEPMQDLMYQHKQTKMDPRSCLRKLLFDRYKFRSGEDNRVVTNKRRKRKPSAAPAISGGAATNKKTKANVNSSFGNSGLNNNIIMSPGVPPSFSLASQDVMVVGEPSMMGGDFGDDNERMITRLENTQYDPTASMTSNTDESISVSAQTVVNDNCINNGTNLDQNLENHTMSPSLMQQQQQHQMPQNHSPQLQQQAAQSDPHQIDQNSPQLIGQQAEHLQQLQQSIDQNLTDHSNLADEHANHQDLIEEQQKQQQQHQESADLQQMHQVVMQEAEVDTLPQMPTDDQQNHEGLQNQDQAGLMDESDLAEEEQEQAMIIKDEDKDNSNLDDSMNNDSSLMLGINSVERSENHTNSVQPVNDESNSNSQLPCPNATTTTSSAMDQQQQQQQPVDNGVA